MSPPTARALGTGYWETNPVRRDSTLDARIPIRVGSPSAASAPLANDADRKPACTPLRHRQRLPVFSAPRSPWSDWSCLLSARIRTFGCVIRQHPSMAQPLPKALRRELLSRFPMPNVKCDGQEFGRQGSVIHFYRGWSMTGCIFSRRCSCWPEELSRVIAQGPPRGRAGGD